MLTIYIDPQGIKHYSRPASVNVNGRTKSPATDALLQAAGWTIEPLVEQEEEPIVQTYEERVVEMIRTRYTADQEFAILRQRDRKPEEFAEYDEYCEECKRMAKEQ